MLPTLTLVRCLISVLKQDVNRAKTDIRKLKRKIAHSIKSLLFLKDLRLDSHLPVIVSDKLSLLVINKVSV